MPYNFEDSKRIKALRSDLIAAVPRVPNDRISLQALKAKSLTDLVITFIAWRLRHVGIRPRQVLGCSNLASDPRAVALKPNIKAFLNVVQTGGDLTPYLSIASRTKGYAPAAETGGPNRDGWADKDFLLNVMGLHHFHLGLTKEAAGHAGRTNELIFASVTRDAFDILGLVDHTVFSYEDDGSMTAERQALWSKYEDRRDACSLPGQLSIGGFGEGGITTSGHPVVVTLVAQNHVRIMREEDPKLDDPQYVSNLYPVGSVPAKPRLKWHYKHLDFGLFDEQAGFFFILQKGPN